MFDLEILTMINKRKDNVEDVFQMKIIQNIYVRRLNINQYIVDR